jgi:hypothetical protein
MNYRSSLLTQSLAVFIVAAILGVTALALPVSGGSGNYDPYALSRASLRFNSPLTSTFEGMSYANSLAAEADKSFRYGVDADGVSFAQAASGVKARFVNLSPEYAGMEFNRSGRVGDVQFTRLTPERVSTRFRASDGETLVVLTTKYKSDVDGRTKIKIVFRYKKEKVSLRIEDVNALQDFDPDSQQQLQKLLSNVRKSTALAQLMGDAKTFTDKTVIAGAQAASMTTVAFTDSLQCIIAAGNCILAIAAYVGSVAALIAACPETVGATCLAALLLHPVFGVMVAAKCADAMQKCNISPPPPPTKAQYQQACLDFGGSWDSFAEECISIPIVFDPSPAECRGFTDFINWPSTGCITGLTFGYSCNRSTAFRSRCDDYDGDTCVCVGNMSMSPIVIDVDHSGFSMTDADHGVVFNILNDDVPLPISWTAPGSTNAFLVLDRNGNGTIDGGAELFGNTTPQPVNSAAANGFIALAEYDKAANGGNGDGRIDASDAAFTNLRLWQDANHNGVSEPGELHTLPELGVKALSLDYKESKRTDGFGNKYRFRAKVYDADGTHTGRWAWDVFVTLKQ